MRKRYFIVSALTLVTVQTALLLGLFPFSSEPLPASKPPTAQAQDDPKPTAVAGVHTVKHEASTDQPAVKLVVSDGRRSRTVVHDPSGGQSGHTPHVPTSPQVPGPQPVVPINVTINLRGPLEYHLMPGKQSPILTYELIDGAQYEWFPGLLSGWIDSTERGEAPVWGTVLQQRPSQPYVDDHVHFIVAARPDTPPGVYKVSVNMVIRPGIILGAPVMVTVPDVGQDS